MVNHYQDTIAYLYGLQDSGIKLGLENANRLLEYLGHPQKKWPAIHIAGTNGKGSTAAFLFYMLREAGYRVGLYTSPHLVDFAERIRVNDELITWEEIVIYTRQLKPQIEIQQATFFEATTAVAFQYFADQKIEIGVIETGLGGRLDATNLVQPIGTIITTISEDHQQYLGNSLPQISREKAGIIKGNIPCFTHNSDPEILDILRQACVEKNSSLLEINPAQVLEILEESISGSHFNLTLPTGIFKNLVITMAGRHQVSNAALAVTALTQIPKFPVKDAAIRQGLHKAQWPGRLQVISSAPLTILDVAHNPDGFLKVFSSLECLIPGKRIWAIVGLSRDKDYAKIADILSRHVFRIGLVARFSERGLEVSRLAETVLTRMQAAEVFQTVEDAFLKYRRLCSSQDVIVIIGSHFLAGEFLKKIQIS